MICGPLQGQPKAFVSDVTWGSLLWTLSTEGGKVSGPRQLWLAWGMKTYLLCFRFLITQEVFVFWWRGTQWLSLYKSAVYPRDREEQFIQPVSTQACWKISPSGEVIWRWRNAHGPLARLISQNIKMSTATFAIEEDPKLWGGQAELHPWSMTCKYYLNVQIQRTRREI